MSYRKGSLVTGISRDYPTINSFDEAERIYNTTKPLQGKRKHLNLRPLAISHRGRCYPGERIVKINDSLYGVVNNWSGCWGPGIDVKEQDNVNRSGILYHRNGLLEISKGIVRYAGMGHMLDTVLPDGLCAIKYDTKFYVCTIDDRDQVAYFLGDTLRFKKVRGKWRCLNSIREKKQLVDIRALWPLVDVEGPNSWDYMGVFSQTLKAASSTLQLTKVLKRLVADINIRRNSGYRHSPAPLPDIPERAYKYWKLETYKNEKPVRYLTVPLGEVCRRPRI